jgi:hypothetical protein
VSYRPYEQSESVPEPPRAEKFFSRSNWKAVTALIVVLVLISLVLNALIYTQPWSKVTLLIYNNLEEPVIVQLYIDGEPINHALQIGPNHTAFTGHGSFSAMGGFPGDITLKAAPGTHAFGIDVCRYVATVDGDSFIGDGVIDSSRSVSVGVFSSNSVVIAVT